MVEFFPYKISSDGHDNEILDINYTIDEIKKYISEYNIKNVQVVQILDKGLLLISEGE